jgi:hypothetical protein
MATTSDRRVLVNLAVFASSAAMFAAAWAGIAQADGDRYVERDGTTLTEMALASVQPSVPLIDVGPAISDAPGSPGPAPRQVVIVRQSRAS